MVNLTGKGGFGDQPKDRLKEITSRGGRVKNPKKGFGSLTKRQRKAISKKAAKARWDKYKKERL